MLRILTSRLSPVLTSQSASYSTSSFVSQTQYDPEHIDRRINDINNRLTQLEKELDDRLDQIEQKAETNNTASGAGGLMVLALIGGMMLWMKMS